MACHYAMVAADWLDPLYMCWILYLVSIMFTNAAIDLGLLERKIIHALFGLFFISYLFVWRAYFAKYQGTDFKFARSVAHLELF